MSDAPILVSDLRPQIAALRPEFDAAVKRVLDRGWFILGEEGRAFETEFAAFLGARHVVGVANGTDAIHLALRAVGIRPGDPVLLPPSTANPTACAVTALGAVPCFADVEPDTGLFQAAALEEAMARLRPRAVIPVHLYGRPERMTSLLALAAKHGVAVIEDVAQAHGAPLDCGGVAGTRGAIGCFSFYPSKNLGAFGDGGALSTEDPELAEALRRLRNYGQADRYHHVSFGLNSRLDELQAAFLRVKLPHLATANDARRAIVARYREALRDLPLALPSDDPSAASSVHHLFVVRVTRRDSFREALRQRGIGTEIHYPVPIHRQEAYAGLGLGPGSFPVAERRAAQIVSLPLYPELQATQIDRVIDAVRAALSGHPHPDEETA
ncbi:MAG: DegT/DnrJ/EryC1/StrS family aminotransferase [Candidatus Eisenbacteria bacterium]|nr:DegT/DnrJ/EryC1/StrS family aminotransferase [Candidatus Eisenbacteria bacterium]MCC7144024.1 DegT/DnrJ/EryC1/StrS family aminotransferase [Candidatus Eisenbacteria bacterium]